MLRTGAVTVKAEKIGVELHSPLGYFAAVKIGQISIAGLDRIENEGSQGSFRRGNGILDWPWDARAIVPV